MGFEPVVYFCNPNLDTETEFQKRLEAQKTICKIFEVDLIIENYNHQEYLDFVCGLENEPERGKRCDKCIELRLVKAIKKAKKLNIDTVTTSLVISPHKNFTKISELGEKLAKNEGINYLAIDFKKKDGFLKTNKLSKELNLYRQNYCGCEFAKNIVKNNSQ